MDELQRTQFQKRIVLKPKRGTIYDRYKRELAVSVPSYSLYGDPKRIRNLKTLSFKLSSILSASKSQIQTKLGDKRRRFVFIERNLNRQAKKKIEALKFKGIHWKEERLRVYPNGHLLSQVLGFIGRNGRGLEGLELEYDEFLRGEKKKLFFKRDAYGRPLLAKGRLSLEEPQGYNIHLTIDRELQFILEEELKEKMKEVQGDSAVGIILHAKTAEILAMANLPSFNLNDPYTSLPKSRRNRSITDVFEPGSSLKTFTIAGALREKQVQPETEINCEKGRLKVKGRYIHEAESTHGFGVLTVTEILAKSSNIGVTKLSMKLGDSVLREVLESFGFGLKTGVDLPGEVKGVLRKLPWNAHLLSNISFGQGVSSTPLQVASAYVAIASGGLLMKPYIVKSLEHPITEETLVFKPHKIRRVLSVSLAKQVKEMLKNSTSSYSTGYRARPSGYEVAGKTSTAQKFRPKKGGYYKNSYISSFIGMIPVENPRYVIYVIIDNPKKAYYASHVAAPLFAKVASYAVRKAGIMPLMNAKGREKIQRGKEEALKVSSRLERKKREEILLRESNWNRLPDLKGLSLKEVYMKLGGEKVQLHVKGHGRVVRTWPSKGRRFPKDRRIKIWLELPKE